MKIKQLVLSCGLVLVSSAALAQTLISDGDLQVTADEFATAIATVLPAGQQDNMRADQQNVIRFLSDYFVFKQMAQAAEKQGLDQKQDIKMQLDYSRWRLLSQALLNEHIAAVKMSDLTPLAKETYLVEKSRFAYPAQVHAAHILIEINAQRNAAAALAQANTIYAQAVKNKQQFAELAQEHSDDPSVQTNKGDLGFFTRDTMIAPFADVAFTMKKGQISKPVKTDYGYHIIRVLETKSAGVKSFDEVKDELIAEQEQKFISAKRSELVDKFRASPDLVVDEAALTEFLKTLK